MTQETNIEGRGLEPEAGSTAKPLSLAHYAALGMACESHGLGWYNEAGEMRFQPPADLIAEQAVSIEVRKREAVEGLNNVLSEKLERRTAALEAAEAKREAVEGESGVLSEKLDCLKRLYDDAMAKWTADVQEFGPKANRCEAAEARANSLEAEVERLRGEVALGDMRASYDELMVEHRRVLQNLNSIDGKLKVADAASAVTAPVLAQMFHEAYERLAHKFGYSTRPESAVPWSEVPATNQALMVATCAEVLSAIDSQES
jgi:hypothetical protein